MKIALRPPEPDGDDPPELEFVRGARQALVTREDGTYLAAIVGP